MGLITNFASGELSPNLFGRVDLPQYHSGAARLENWDVIPTGGIKRRSGMEYLAEIAVTEKSRLIPIIISRSEKYLLLFTHEKIDVYKAGGKSPIKTFSNTDVNPERLYSENEIHEVQYAQDINTLILTHENHPPFSISFYNEPELRKLNVSFLKTVDKGEDVTDDDASKYRKDEDSYKKNGWLTTAGNYPAAVCFFNGRLVFAGTKKNPQKFFVSSFKEENKAFNFSISKIFLKEDRKYIVVKGSVNDDKYTVTIEDLEGLKFASALEKYYVESPFYDPGTMIVNVKGNILTLSKEAILTFLNNTQRSDLENMVNFADNDKDRLTGTSRTVKQYIEYYNNPAYIYGVRDEYSSPPVNPYISYTYTVQLIVGATKIKFITTDNRGNSPVSKEIPLDKEAVFHYENNTSYYDTFVRSNLPGTTSTELSVIDENALVAAIEELRNNSLATMKYVIEGEPYYNFPSIIKNYFERKYEGAQNIYIPFYTRNILVDEYPTPDCGFTFELASGKNDAIKWLSVNRGIIIGTELSEYVMPPDVHATTPPYVVALSKYGSDNIPGEAVGAATVFFQSGRKGLVEYYPNEYDQFRANNMALLAQHMLHESAAKEFDFATAPYTRLYVTREDGALVTLLYERNTGTFAWNRITTGEVTRNMITPEEVEEARKIKEQYRNSGDHYDHSPFEPPVKMERFVEGKILTCAVLPGDDGFDDAYLIVKRGSKFFLERLRDAGTVYLDSWREWKWAYELDKRRLLESYTPDAVVYDENEVKVYELSAPTGQLPPSSEEGSRRYIGYPYKSVFKSMPVVRNEKMGPVHMSAMCVRLHDSYAPYIWGDETSRSEAGKTLYDDDVIKETNILSGQSRTTQFHITHDAPNRCRVLSVYTEV